MLETHGIATVVVGLVRPHMEATRPPRGLWVPFPLGRPFGEPGDAAFQRRVLLAALDLLERKNGPVLLEDFSEDAPSMRESGDWTPGITTTPPTAAGPGTPEHWRAALQAELDTVLPHWRRAQQRFGRTTVGNAGLEPADWAPFAVGFLDEPLPGSIRDGLSAALLLRYIADDIKTLYSEAVQADGSGPSSNAINDWFWNRTVAGALLRALRTAALASEDRGFNTVGSRFIVPAPWVSPTPGA